VISPLYFWQTCRYFFKQFLCFQQELWPNSFSDRSDSLLILQSDSLKWTKRFGAEKKWFSILFQKFMLENIRDNHRITSRHRQPEGALLNTHLASPLLVLPLGTGPSRVKHITSLAKGTVHQRIATLAVIICKAKWHSSSLLDTSQSRDMPMQQTVTNKSTHPVHHHPHLASPFCPGSPSTWPRPISTQWTPQVHTPSSIVGGGVTFAWMNILVTSQQCHTIQAEIQVKWKPTKKKKHETTTINKSKIPLKEHT
jgi:hypothetical protein